MHFDATASDSQLCSCTALRRVAPALGQDRSLLEPPPDFCSYYYDDK